MSTIRELIAESHVFSGLPHDVLEKVAGCGRLDHFEAGEDIIHVGQPAATFHIVRHGRVAIQIAAPGREPLVVATRGEGDAIAVEPTRVISLDGECLRGKCETDHELGYHLMSRFADVAIRDLELTQLQLLDVYGHVAVR